MVDDPNRGEICVISLIIGWLFGRVRHGKKTTTKRNKTKQKNGLIDWSFAIKMQMRKSELKGKKSSGLCDARWAGRPIGRPNPIVEGGSDLSRKR